MKKARSRPRRLEDLVSVGPSIRRDLNALGVQTVEQLAKRDPRALYDRLCRQTGQRQDPCVLDTFRAAVAQAKDPDLPVEYAVWWFWSRVRKGEIRAPLAKPKL
jgi:nucleotidyltransferase/DNA polymerase involved in DNA repair